MYMYYLSLQATLQAGPGISKTDRARSRRGRILRSWVCFDAPSHIPHVFVARVVNKNIMLTVYVD